MDSLKEVFDVARSKAVNCHCCPRCDGKACRGETPGVGGKGNGDSFVRNVEKLHEIKLVYDTIATNDAIDTSTTFFNHRVSLPVFAAPISGIEQNYGAKMSDGQYTELLVEGCNLAGTIAFSGDGMQQAMFKDPLTHIKNNHGIGVPTIKPWLSEEFEWRAQLSKEAAVIAVACDIDASGLSNLRHSKTPVGFKDVADLKQLKSMVNCPLIIKGVLSVEGALKALDAGCDAIVVSNHGGRVLDECVSGIEMLEAIVEAVQGKMKIYVDGGFRSGFDVFKALAMGADGVLIGRPISLALIGDGAKGLQCYFAQIKSELEDAMAMCGCKTIKEIKRKSVKVDFK
ncbi:MAG: alpha-hydroxy-acid oxidizing protein [Erysipelotrichaceae bacterium]